MSHASSVRLRYLLENGIGKNSMSRPRAWLDARRLARRGSRAELQLVFAWSCGDLAFDNGSGLVWQVYAHRGDQRIVVRAGSQAEAWVAAAAQAGGIGRGSRR